MEITTYLRIINRRKWVILATTIITFAVVAYGRTQIPNKYVASAIVRVIPSANDNPSYAQLAYADRIMNTYAQIGSGSVVMSTLREEIKLNLDEPLSVEIKVIPDTELLKITVTDYDPLLASDVANALASYMINDRSIRDVIVTLVEPAIVPEPPSMLIVTLFYILAGLTGAIGGIGLVFLLEGIDTRIYEEKQIERVSDYPVLGKIPAVSIRSGLSREVIAAKYPYNHFFGRMATNLLMAAKHQELHTIMVTSPEPREGKSTIATNLAYSLAEAGQKTLLIDMDLYRPTLHKYFETPNHPGLRDFLLTKCTLESAIYPTTLPSLWVLPSGELLEKCEGVMTGSQKVAEVFEQITQEYDFVILDSPAFLGVSDGLMLSSLVDGILIVVKLGKTRQPTLEAVYQQIANVQANIIGIVVNRVEKRKAAAYYRYYQPGKGIHFINLLRQKWQRIKPALGKTIIEPSPEQAVTSQNTPAETPVENSEVPKEPTRRMKMAKKQVVASQSMPTETPVENSEVPKESTRTRKLAKSS
jgi:succinoglycan biosynthesis transport protein ExoP